MSHPPRQPGTPRKLPDFLKTGNAELGAGQLRFNLTRLVLSLPKD